MATCLNLSPRESAALRKLARRLGTTQTDLVRQWTLNAKGIIWVNRPKGFKSILTRAEIRHGTR